MDLFVFTDEIESFLPGISLPYSHQEFLSSVHWINGAWKFDMPLPPPDVDVTPLPPPSPLLRPRRRGAFEDLFIIFLCEEEETTTAKK